MKESIKEEDCLVLWTVYDHPLDYPDSFVTRKSLVVPGRLEPFFTNDLFTADTLEEIRALLPPGLSCLKRFPGDDPKIVEVWL